MQHASQHITADDLRQRIHALNEDEKLALLQLHLLDDRKREIEKYRARIQGSIYAFEKMLNDMEQR